MRIPQLFNVAATNQTDTFVVNTDHTNRLYIGYIALATDIPNTFDAASYQVSGQEAVDLPIFGQAPWMNRQMRTTQDIAPGRGIPPIDLRNNIWPVDITLEPGQSLAFTYHLPFAPLGGTTVRGAAYGWLVPPDDHYEAFTPVVTPSQPSTQTLDDTYTLPVVPSIPDPTTPAVPNQPPIQVSWNIVEPGGVLSRLPSVADNYPSDLSENIVGPKVDRNKVTIGDQITRTFAHLFGAGLNSAKAIRASLTGKLHAGEEYIQSEAGEYYDSTDTPLTVTPDEPLESLKIWCVTGSCTVQTLNTQEARNSVDITSQPAVLLRPGQLKTLNRDIAAFYVALEAGALHPIALGVRWYGER
jgi:hypothetical protein